VQAFCLHVVIVIIIGSLLVFLRYICISDYHIHISRTNTVIVDNFILSQFKLVL